MAEGSGATERCSTTVNRNWGGVRRGSGGGMEGVRRGGDGGTARCDDAPTTTTALGAVVTSVNLLL
eukprot:1185432-Prorocentrum_minimum.AAC.6